MGCSASWQQAPRFFVLILFALSANPLAAGGATTPAPSGPAGIWSDGQGSSLEIRARGTTWDVLYRPAAPQLWLTGTSPLPDKAWLMEGRFHTDRGVDAFAATIDVKIPPALKLPIESSSRILVDIRMAGPDQAIVVLSPAKQSERKREYRLQRLSAPGIAGDNKWNGLWRGAGETGSFRMEQHAEGLSFHPGSEADGGALPAFLSFAEGLHFTVSSRGIGLYAGEWTTPRQKRIPASLELKSRDQLEMRLGVWPLQASQVFGR